MSLLTISWERIKMLIIQIKSLTKYKNSSREIKKLKKKFY